MRGVDAISVFAGLVVVMNVVLWIQCPMLERVGVSVSLDNAFRAARKSPHF